MLGIHFMLLRWIARLGQGGIRRLHLLRTIQEEIRDGTMIVHVLVHLTMVHHQDTVILMEDAAVTVEMEVGEEEVVTEDEEDEVEEEVMEVAEAMEVMVAEEDEEATEEGEECLMRQRGLSRSRL